MTYEVYCVVAANYRVLGPPIPEHDVVLGVVGSAEGAAKMAKALSSGSGYRGYSDIRVRPAKPKNGMGPLQRVKEKQERWKAHKETNMKYRKMEDSTSFPARAVSCPIRKFDPHRYCWKETASCAFFDGEFEGDVGTLCRCFVTQKDIDEIRETHNRRRRR